MKRDSFKLFLASIIFLVSSLFAVALAETIHYNPAGKSFINPLVAVNAGEPAYQTIRDSKLTHQNHPIGSISPTLVRPFQNSLPTISDHEGPIISNMDPAQDTNIEAIYTFSATVTESSGIESVTFVIQYPDGITTQNFSASDSGEVWSKSLRGFSEGDWQWWVVAKNNETDGGRISTSIEVGFSVSNRFTGGNDNTGGKKAGTIASYPPAGLKGNSVILSTSHSATLKKLLYERITTHQH